MASAALARRTARSLDRAAYEPPQRSERRFSRTKSDPRSGGSRNTLRTNALPPIESANSLVSNNKDIAQHGPCGPGTNIYGKVLGQTADETILVGLQMFKKIRFAQLTSPSNEEGTWQTSSTADRKKDENDRKSSQRTNQDHPSHDGSKDRRMDRNDELNEHYSEEEISDNGYEEETTVGKYGENERRTSDGSRRGSRSEEFLAHEVDGERGRGSSDLEYVKKRTDKISDGSKNKQESLREVDDGRRIGTNGSEELENPFVEEHSEEGTGRRPSFEEGYSDEELKHESSRTDNIGLTDQQSIKRESETSTERERMESQTEIGRRNSIIVEESESMVNNDSYVDDSPEEISPREVDSQDLNPIQTSEEGEDSNEIHQNLQRSVESRIEDGEINRSSSPGSSFAAHSSFHTHDSFDVPAVDGSHVSHDIHSSFDTNGSGTHVSQHTQSVRSSRGSQSFRGSPVGSGIPSSQHSQSIHGSQGSRSIRGSQDGSGSRGSQQSQSIRGSQGSRSIRGSQDASGSRGSQHSQSIRVSQGSRSIRGSQDGSGSRGSQHSQSIRVSQGSRSIRGSQDGSGSRGSQYSQSIRGSHDSQSVRGSNDSSGIRGINEVSSGEEKDISMPHTVLSSLESGGHSSRSGSKQSPLSSGKTSAKSESSDSSPSRMKETRHSDSSRSAGSTKSEDRPVKEASRTSRGSSSGSKQLKIEDSVKSVNSSKSVNSKNGYNIQSEALVSLPDSRSGGSRRNSNKDLSTASEDVKLQLNRSQKEVAKPKGSSSILKDSSSSSKSKSDTSGSISCTCSYSVSSPEKTEKASREQLSKLNSCSCCSCSKEKIEVCPARKSCFKAAQKICDICCRESGRTVLEMAGAPSQKKVRLCCDCSTSTSSCLTPGLGGSSALMQKGDGYGLQGRVRYSITKITDYGEFTTFEIMKSTRKMPKTMPTSLEGVFVLRRAASRT